MTPLQAGWKTCVHHFVYPPPNGPIALGQCKKCGRLNESKNSIQYNGWNGNSNIKLRKKKKEL